MEGLELGLSSVRIIALKLRTNPYKLKRIQEDLSQPPSRFGDSPEGETGCEPPITEEDLALARRDYDVMKS